MLFFGVVAWTYIGCSTSNFAEQFNNVMKPWRSDPCITLARHMLQDVAAKHFMHQTQSVKWKNEGLTITPQTTKEYESRLWRSRNKYDIRITKLTKFEVQAEVTVRDSNPPRSFIVDLRQGNQVRSYCACLVWYDSGVLFCCIHLMCV